MYGEWIHFSLEKWRLEICIWWVVQVCGCPALESAATVLTCFPQVLSVRLCVASAFGKLNVGHLTFSFAISAAVADLYHQTMARNQLRMYTIKSLFLEMLV